MEYLTQLKSAVSKTLQGLNARELASMSDSCGLSLQEPDMIESLSEEDLILVGRALLREYSTLTDLGDLNLLVASSYGVQLSVRREIVDYLVLKGGTNGKLRWNDFGQRFIDLKSMPSTDSRHNSAYADVGRHMDANDDWTVEEFLWNYLDLQHASDGVFKAFLEQVVHPVVRDAGEAEEWVAGLNGYLRKVDLQLSVHERIAGYPIWKVTPMRPDQQLALMLPSAGTSLVTRLEILKEALARAVRGEGGRVADSEFRELRNDLRTHPYLAIDLPYFMRDYRSFDEAVHAILATEDRGFGSSSADVVFETLNPILDRLEHVGFAYSPDFEILEKLGEGGFGVVHKVRHRLMDRYFAVKLQQPSPFIQSDDTLRPRFWREAKMLFDLDHPNIVKIYDACEINGIPCLRMEYIEGLTLTDLVSEHGCLNIKKAAVLAYKVADALAHAHSLNIIHRDLKPSNVMLRVPEVVKVLDFGIGAYIEHLLDSRLTPSGVKVAGGSYTAPELEANPKLLDPRVDIYSLGALWYFALVGQPPRGPEAKDKLNATNPNLPSDYVGTLLKCLAETERRFASAAEARDAIAEFRV